MSALEAIKVPDVESLEIRLSTPPKLSLAGTITAKDPAQALGSFFKSVHEAAKADELPEFLVDVSRLTFVNSSAIRLFVDWATWIQQSKRGAYTLRFLTDRSVTWQRTSFTALCSIAQDVLQVEHVN
jgi:hypothetical protein